MKPVTRLCALGAALMAGACSTMAEFTELTTGRGQGAQAQPPADDWGAANFQAWSPETPDYLLYPGDQVRVSVPSAPELTQEVTIGPDGRFNFPYAGAVMAANRSTPEVEASLSSALSRDLRRPYVEITPIGWASQKILVLGEVAEPGLYDLPGPMGALEAVAMAGGFSDSADRGSVSIIRRATNGRPMQREVNLNATLRGRDGGDYDVLARFDIVFVPRSGIANANLFVQQYIRDLVPFNVGFSYAVGDNYNGGSVSGSVP